jgi:hypothetical protein
MLANLPSEQLKTKRNLQQTMKIKPQRNIILKLCITALMLLASCIPLHAIDLNGNGLSDVWELKYGFLSAIDSPSADSDGDGDSNLVESIFGTNPYASNSRRPIISLSAPNPNLAFSFPSVKGARYQIEGKDNLLNTTWDLVGTPVTGTGLAFQGNITGPFGARYFLRLSSLPSIDGESDGLTAYEEGLLGSSDAAANSDTDTLTDLEEVKLQFLYGVEADPTKEFTGSALNGVGHRGARH